MTRKKRFPSGTRCTFSGGVKLFRNFFRNMFGDDQNHFPKFQTPFDQLFSWPVTGYDAIGCHNHINSLQSRPGQQVQDGQKPGLMSRRQKTSKAMQESQVSNLEERLQKVIGEAWGAVPLTLLPMLLAEVKKKKNSPKLSALLQRFPNTLQVVKDAKGRHWAVLVDTLLLPALNGAVRALVAQGISTLAQVAEYVARGRPLRLDLLASLTGRETLQHLLSDAGLLVAADGVISFQPLTKVSELQRSLAAIKSRLREVATMQLDGVDLSHLPDLLPADWTQHRSSVEDIVLRFPDTVTLITRQNKRWVVLVREWLFAVVRIELKAILHKSPTKVLSLDALVKAFTNANLALVAAAANYQKLEPFLADLGFFVKQGPSRLLTMVHTDKARSLQLSGQCSLLMTILQASLTTAPLAAADSTVQAVKEEVLSPVEVVIDPKRCREVVKLLTSDQPLALDCEGRLWGKIEICLVQIASKSGKIYLFDIKEGGPALFTEGELRLLLEDTSVLKVGHDLRSDASALYSQFNVFLNHAFDTQGRNLPSPPPRK